MERANGLTMPVYLWHMVPLVIVADVAYPTHLLAQPPIGSGAWWAQRVAWVALLVVVLAVVLAVLAVASRRVGRSAGRSPPWAVAGTRPASKLGLAVLLVGITVAAAGLGRLAVQGFAPNGSLDAGTVIGFGVGVVLVWCGGRRAVRGERQSQGAFMTDDDKTPIDDLKAEAKEHIEAMPAETILGNRDPKGGGKGTPADYEAKHEGRHGK